MKKSKIKMKIGKTSQLALFAIFVGVLGILFIGQQLTASFSAHSVLGTTTLLAKGGDDSGGDSHGGSGSSGGSNSGSGSSGSNSSSGSSGGSSSGNSGSGNSGGSSSNNGSVSSSTKVLCTGPDGKQFETKLKDCEELNKAWNKPVTFTTLTQPNTIKTESRTRSTSLTPTTSHAPEQQNENNQETRMRTNTEITTNETKTEVRLSESERIRTRTKDGQTRIDITSGGVKTRLEYKDGRVIIKAEQKNGTEVELEDNTLLKIDERLAKDNIKIATTSGQEFVLQKGTTGAVTAFPLSVDLATNTLTVNTPLGQSNIAVLPDQAVQNVIAANIVNRIGGQAIVDAANRGQLSSVNQLITLGEKNGIPVYEIAGLSDQKLLGFIPVAIPKTVTVSAQTGTVISTQESLANKVLDLIAF